MRSFGILLVFILLADHARAQAPDDVRTLVRQTYAAVASDPKSAAALFHLPADRNASAALTSLTESLHAYHRLRSAATAKNIPLPNDPLAFLVLGLPASVPADLDQVEPEGRGEFQTLSSFRHPYELRFRKIAGQWKWDLASTFAVEEPAEWVHLDRYLGALHSGLDAAIREVEAGKLADAKAINAAIDRAAVLDLMSAHLTDADPKAPAPKTDKDETRLASNLGRLTALSVSPDGQRALVGAMSAKHPLRLWNLKEARGERTINLGDSSITDVYKLTFSPDGKFAAALGVAFHAGEILELRRRDNPKDVWGSLESVHTVWIIDTATWTVTRSLTTERDFQQSLAFSPDSQHLVAPGTFESWLWETDTGKLLHKLPGGQAVAFAQDGSIALLGLGDDLSFIDPATGKVTRTLTLSQANPDRKSGLLAFSPDGKTLAYGTLTGVVAIDPANGKERRRFPLPAVKGYNRVNAVAFSKDGSRLAAASGLFALDNKTGATPFAPLITFDRTNYVCLWETTSRGMSSLLSSNARLLFSNTAHPLTVSGVAFTSDESALITTSTDGTLRRWAIPAKTAE